MTEIPLPTNDEYIEDVFLGPSFELTSAGMSFPSSHATREIQKERLSLMESDVRKLIKSCRGSIWSGRESTLGRLEYVADTFLLLGQEFEYRSGPPPPKPQVDDPLLEFSEDAQQFDPDIDMVIYLKLDFEGWAQCRLPIDPDASNERRGFGGSSSYTNEPDLDRIIRFQPPGTVVRSALPADFAIGVTVRKAVIHTPAGEYDAPSVFNGAMVDLLDAPSFQGRNHIVAMDGKEIIDPFHLQISAVDGQVLLDRKGKGPSLTGLSAGQRVYSGRAPVKFKMAPNVNLYNIGRSDLIGNPNQYWTERIELLERRLGQLTELDAEAVAIKARRNYIKDNLRDYSRHQKPAMITRMSFWEQYRHKISGVSGLAYSSEQPLPFQTLKGEENPWLVSYDLGFFDTDAQSFYAKGTLYVPIRQIRDPSAL